MRLALIYILMVITTASFAQKVGLVLSGGGARGIAHIGVIKALEEHNIPISYVTGTSMGAIIGGMYACGYSPEQMEKIVTSPEFLYWSSGNIPEKYFYYFKEESSDPSWLQINFRWDSIFKPSFPTSIVSPVMMDLAFLEIFSQPNALSKGNFDSLFVPFRCVSSDIEASRTYVPKRGELAKIIRASMSIPFVFKPVVIKGRLLFDGGIYNNFPADEMNNEFKPNVIIGSQVVTNFDPPDPEDILTHIENLIVSKTEYDIEIDSGLIICPKVQDVSIMDFSQAKKLINIGYKTTIDHIDEIKKLVHDSISKTEVDKRRKEYVSKWPKLLINQIHIKGVNYKQANYINTLLMKKSDLVMFEEMKKEYLKIMADDKIAGIYPELVYNESSGLFDLYLDVNLQKEFCIKIGGNMSSSASSQSFIGWQYKMFRERAFSLKGNMYFSKFYMSAQAKARVDFAYRLPFYFEGDLTLNRWDFYKSSGAFFQNFKPSYLIENEQHMALNVGFPVYNKGKIVTGIGQGYNIDEYYHYQDFKNYDKPDYTYFNFVSLYGLYERSTLNKKQYADAGTFIKLMLKYLKGNELNEPGSTSLIKKSESFYHHRYMMRFIYQNYFKKIQNLKLGFYSEVFVSNQSFFNNHTATLLQAPLFAPTPDSKTLFLENFRSYNYAALGLQFIYMFNTHFHFRNEVYLYQPYQKILKIADNKSKLAKPFASSYWMTSSALVYHTPIGPVSLSISLYDRNYKNYSLLFNFGYIIFNEKIAE